MALVIFDHSFYMPVMPHHAEKRIVPYTNAEMYALVADVKSYPQFLPWVSALRVTSRHAKKDTDIEIIDADMVVAFKLFREKFASRVCLNPNLHKIDVEYLDGPFKYLNNHWHFNALDNNSCEIDFSVDFEFKSRILQSVIGLVFNEAMQRIVRAFEKRAETLYGPRSLDLK